MQANLLLIIYSGDLFKACDLVVPDRVILHPRARIVACLAEMLLTRVTNIREVQKLSTLCAGCALISKTGTEVLHDVTMVNIDDR